MTAENVHQINMFDPPSTDPDPSRVIGYILYIDDGSKMIPYTNGSATKNSRPHIFPTHDEAQAHRGWFDVIAPVTKETVPSC